MRTHRRSGLFKSKFALKKLFRYLINCAGGGLDKIDFYEIMIFESLPFFKNYLFNKLYNVLTCTPVAPFGRYFSAFDKYAVPAISK